VVGYDGFGGSSTDVTGPAYRGWFRRVLGDAECGEREYAPGDERDDGAGRG
jgi:hypothetical protein